jgi:hypothetical protein
MAATPPPMPPTSITVEAYREYVSKFDARVGTLGVGAYGKFEGKLVRKLGAEEFATRHSEFVTLDKTYRGIIERGDTINDAVVRLWRERRAELLIDGPEPGSMPDL